MKKERCLKNLIRKITDLLFAHDEQSLKKVIHRYEMVSFDIFDTLVKRDVRNPEDIFSLVQVSYNQFAEDKIDDFKEQRQKAEQSAKECAKAEEITIEDIYNKLSYSKKQKELLRTIELKMEVEFCTVNISLKKIYDMCVKEGKEICFISDMYLPEEIVKEILIKCGYEKGILFVSSKYQKRKRNGVLFSVVQEKFHKKSWLHIGDNLCSDVIAARKNGIRGILIKRDIVNTTYSDFKRIHENLSYNTMTAFINNRIQKYHNSYEKIGYEVFGPILYGFVMWLEKNTNAQEKIVFLAREGKIMKKAFEIINSQKETIYMHVSRHAVCIPYLEEFNTFNGFEKVFRNTIHRLYTNREFCKECGLKENDIQEILFRLNLEENELCTRDTQEKIVTRFENIIKENAKLQKELLGKYINQIGICKENVLVDVGWHGTIQKQLTGLCYRTENDEEISFRGMYIGIRNADTNETMQIMDKCGYIDFIKSSYISSVLAYTITFFEMFFLGTDGTTIEYKMDNENAKIVPVLGKPENRIVEKNIHYMQDAALNFVKDINSHKLHKIFDFDSEDTMRNYVNMTTRAKKKTRLLFANFKVYDGNEYLLMGAKSFLYYFLHPWQFEKDFLNNRCKLWFLKNLLVIPFPYVKFLDVLKKYDK